MQVGGVCGIVHVRGLPVWGASIHGLDNRAIARVFEGKSSMPPVEVTKVSVCLRQRDELLLSMSALARPLRIAVGVPHMDQPTVIGTYGFPVCIVLQFENGVVGLEVPSA